MTVRIPDPLAERLAAAAHERGISVDELAAEALAERFDTVPAPDHALDAFIGCFDSGDPDWAATDTAELRKRASHPG